MIFIQTKMLAHRITMRPRILVNVREIDMTTILDQNKCVCIQHMYIYIYIESQLTDDGGKMFRL